MVGKQDPIGIIMTVPDAVDPMPVYDDPAGIAVAVEAGPYLLSDGVSLVDPVPVVDAQGPIWTDAAGQAVDALAADLTP